MSIQSIITHPVTIVVLAIVLIAFAIIYWSTKKPCCTECVVKTPKKAKSRKRYK